ncbi:FkbM family methyltransferase [Sphingomonas donggukensis]|uniref:FkbM family methyltransferase n=1 Tax=Sphingomonas donggukensis TaxID=2949093 RepID=A0ABY4TVU0_9SPHN|nr:FkbM family methyltransferase [Sphingomonas donggukensis]URW74443.1 FkbM family methyltransferase [Sphingomonas donggukensis]
MTWRIGRSLYLAARDETANAIATNGEADLIHRVFAAARAQHPDRPIVAFDIGANLGEWTVAALAAAGNAPCRIEVFEPVPDAIAATTNAIAAVGGGDRATVNPVAISDRDGETEMHLVGPTAGTNSLDGPAVQGSRTITVRLAALETIVGEKGIDHIDLMKIDTEGHDIAILRAMAPLLARGLPAVVQFEYNHRWLHNRGSLHEVFTLVAGTGYRVGRVLPDAVALFAEWNPELDRYFEANYVLVRADVADAIGARSVHWDVSNVPA